MFVVGAVQRVATFVEWEDVLSIDAGCVIDFALRDGEVACWSGIVRIADSDWRVQYGFAVELQGQGAFLQVDVDDRFDKWHGLGCAVGDGGGRIGNGNVGNTGQVDARRYHSLKGCEFCRRLIGVCSEIVLIGRAHDIELSG